jgi:predicted NBD/HSP70 family sugar kinase
VGRLARGEVHRADQAGQRDAAEDADDESAAARNAENCEAAIDTLCATHSPSGVIDENRVLR